MIEGETLGLNRLERVFLATWNDSTRSTEVASRWGDNR